MILYPTCIWGKNVLSLRCSQRGEEGIMAVFSPFIMLLNASKVAQQPFSGGAWRKYRMRFPTIRVAYLGCGYDGCGEAIVKDCRKCESPKDILSHENELDF